MLENLEFYNHGHKFVSRNVNKTEHMHENCMMAYAVQKFIISHPQTLNYQFGLQLASYNVMWPHETYCFQSTVTLHVGYVLMIHNKSKANLQT